jgi:hypothetical protein
MAYEAMFATLPSLVAVFAPALRLCGNRSPLISCLFIRVGTAAIRGGGGWLGYVIRTATLGRLGYVIQTAMCIWGVPCPLKSCISYVPP